MKRINIVIAINVAIITAAVAINYFRTSPRGDYFFGRFAGAGLVILATALINIIIGLTYINIFEKKDYGRSYLLVGGIILLIGFSVCSLPAIS